MLALETQGLVDDVSKTLFLAKKLSNRASFLITMRKFDESIALLTRALKLTKKKFHFTAPSEYSSSHKFCNLESCVSMNQEMFFSILHCEQMDYYNRDDCHSPSSEYKRDEYFRMRSEECQNDFLYRRPLLVPELFIGKNHCIGTVLSLVILYNLALSHHLKALAANDSPTKRKILNQSLKLYELAYQLHINYEQKYQSQEYSKDEQNVGSLRLIMIIVNNLGQIHKVVGNAEKHEMCLQHLLSAIMYMVDSNLVDLDSSEMDGFYRNVSRIMISGICARAA